MFFPKIGEWAALNCAYDVPAPGPGTFYRYSRGTIGQVQKVFEKTCRVKFWKGTFNVPFIRLERVDVK